SARSRAVPADRRGTGRDVPLAAALRAPGALPVAAPAEPGADPGAGGVRLAALGGHRGGRLDRGRGAALAPIPDRVRGGPARRARDVSLAAVLGPPLRPPAGPQLPPRAGDRLRPPRAAGLAGDRAQPGLGPARARLRRRARRSRRSGPRRPQGLRSEPAGAAGPPPAQRNSLGVRR